MEAGELLVKTGSFTHVTWNVHNFHNLLRRFRILRSTEFQFAGIRWRLYMSKRNEDYVCIRLQKLSISVPNCSVYFTLGLQTSRFELELFNKLHYFDDGTSKLGVTTDVSLSDLEQVADLHLSDDALVVLCTLRDMTCWREEEYEKSQYGLPSLEKLQHDYKKLLESGSGDVCLVVSGIEYRAHECILKARSPVFCAMFDHDTAEKASKKVNIDDLDPDSFPSFLEYLYAGCVEELSDDNVFGLYIAADKYDIQTLKLECLEYMLRSLSVESFCDVMMLTLKYNEDELKDLAIDFFKKNIAKIIVTVKWQMFLNENGTKANELLIKALVPEADQLETSSHGSL